MHGAQMKAMAAATVVGKAAVRGKGEWNWTVVLNQPEGGMWAKSLKRFSAKIVTAGGMTPTELVR